MTRKEYENAREAAAEPYIAAMRSTITRVCINLIHAGIMTRNAAALQRRATMNGACQLMAAVVNEGVQILEKLNDLAPLETDDLDVYQWEREVLDDAIATCKAFIEEWRDKEYSIDQV